MYLKDLFEQIGVTSEIDKVAVATLVYEALESNKCGVTGDNREAVIETLINGVCDRHTFNLMSFAADWANDVCYELIEHNNLKCKNMFKEYIFPYISEHEVIPGVKM